MSLPFSRVTLVGMGLMGGSLARSLKALANPPFVHGISTELQELEEALRVGALDEGSEPDGMLPSDQDLVVYATPLHTALTLMEEHRDQLLDTGAVVTDLVSLKAPVMERAGDLGLHTRFVGSHPMVGGTGSGFGSSRKGLYAGARVWVVPGEAEPLALSEVEALWEGLEARPARIQAVEHDRRMAWVSHLPQLAANALALAMEAEGFRPEDLGTGGMDMTRLASSSPGMWVDLLESAPPASWEALAALETQISQLRKRLEEGHPEEFRGVMERTRKWRGTT